MSRFTGNTQTSSPRSSKCKVVVSFKYLPSGRRIEKVSPTTTSMFAYDGHNLIETTNTSGGVVARYAQGLNIDEPLAMLRSSTTSYYQADGLGSITLLSSSAGSLAQTYTFDSFGKQTATSGSLVNPFQYTARESDPETGLYYYRARYYEPSAGRFLSEAPLRFKGDADFYSYVQNHPSNLNDPTGLYALQGFSPANAVEMMYAINRVIDKLNSDQCCVADPGIRKKLLGYLSGGNNGSGVTFVGHSFLPANDRGAYNCGRVGDLTDKTRITNFTIWLSNRVEIGSWDLPGCTCLPATIIHELVHLTTQDFFNPSADKPDAIERSCFGSNNECN